LNGQENPELTVVRGGALGDFVVTLPALRALAGAGALRLVGNRAAAAALAPELFGSIESIDDPRWAGLFADEVALPPMAGPAIAVTRDRGVAARLRRAGCGPVCAAAPSPRPGSTTHVADHLLVEMAAGRPPARPDLAPRPEAASTARERLARLGVERAYAVVHPGSGSARKNWPVERFATVVGWLAGRGLAVLVLAGPADAAPARALAAAASDGGAPTTLLEGAPLAEVAAAVEGARLYVGNDSGVSHVAAAVGAPTLAIFGPTRASRWAPRGRRVAVVEPPARCPTCLAADDRPAECDCLLKVSPESVIAAARLLLR
jgi:heptosyltransferase-2